jgi:protein suppressor of PHYA-105 1
MCMQRVHAACACRVHMPAAELPTARRIASLAFSPASPAQLLSCGDASGAIHLWDVSAYGAAAAAAEGTGAHATAAAPTVFAGHSERVRSLSFSAQAPATFASGSDDCSMRVWDVRCAARPAAAAELGSNVCGVAFSPWDEKVLACGTAAHAVSVYDIRNCKTPLSRVQGALPSHTLSLHCLPHAPFLRAA